MLPKSQYQVLSFLANFLPKTDLDSEMIVAFIEKRYKITPKTAVFSSVPTDNLVDAQLFSQWFNSGLGATEIAKYGNNLVILGNCTATDADIVGTLSDNSINCDVQSVPASELSPASETEHNTFQQALMRQRLQYNSETMRLETKYIPQPLSKVIFHNHNHSIKGLGIVRTICQESGEVELFCYYIYPTKGVKDGKVGYSMHESNIVNLSEYTFEPLLDDSNRFSQDDGISAYRRLKRELEKVGKVWKDKLSRIEPSNMKVKKGEKYFYISDKMTVRSDTEKETPTSNFRYLAGNYFTSEYAANQMLNKFDLLLTDYLASEEWPIIND